MTKKLDKMSKQELQKLFKKRFGAMALKEAIANKYKKYDYLFDLAQIKMTIKTPDGVMRIVGPSIFKEEIWD